MPLRFHLIVTPSDEVTSLRREVDELRQELQRERDKYRMVEYRYGCEVRMIGQILDYCREQGYILPPRLLQRPYGVD